MEKVWWENPMRVIQYNLQVKDTPEMVPDRIAQELVEDNANAVVINVGGIYAWYRSRVPYHHVNEFLPEQGDLLKELLEACHARDIRVIARFDFSQAEDRVFLHHPEWFVQQEDHTPLIRGKERMGDWSMLLTTCINGGYRNEEVAEPVLREVLGEYDIDGIFFNAPFGAECHCQRCKGKYEELYGEAMPENAIDWKKEWQSDCLRDNMRLLKKAVKEIRPDVPIILYYYGFDLIPGMEWPVDNLDDRYATADLICTEAQNVLSQGISRLPAIWKPMINMKIGNAVPGNPRPFGIIHSCPGMDWRHTGLPKREYLFWMAQVAANQGYLWHSVTGFHDTITDKRLLSAVREINGRIMRCEDKMVSAVSAAEVLLLWDGKKPASGWVEGMVNMQYQFDLMDLYHPDTERMKQYKTVILPDEFPVDETWVSVLEEYVREGGCLLIEKSKAENLHLLRDLAGIGEEAVESQPLTASYLRLETKDEKLRRGLEEVTFLPLRGSVLYTRCRAESAMLLSLVPPFAPMDGVGAPPERASLPAARTDLALVLSHPYGSGRVLTFAFSLSSLILAYHLEDHYLLMRNCLDYLCDSKEFEMEQNVAGLLTNVYHVGGDRILVHLINGIGQRPLVGGICCEDLKFTLRLPKGKVVEEVTADMEEEMVSWHQKGNMAEITLDRLQLWNMLTVRVGVREQGER